MMKYIKAVCKWIFRKETLTNALYSIKIAKAILTSNEAKSLNKNEAIIRKLEIAQDQLDRITKILPNESLQDYSKKINIDTDQNRFGDFNADIEEDRHGYGNNGIRLGLKTNVLGVPIDTQYKPTDGSDQFKLGPFSLNL